MTKTQQILVLCITFILMSIIITTAALLSNGTAVPGKNLRKKDPTPDAIKKVEPENEIYKGLGELRCITADKPSISVVIAPFFPYPAQDIAFFEELSSKNRKLQQIIQTYTKMHTHEELLSMGEKKIKGEIIELFNKNLVLGGIDTLYFEEYIFFE